MEDIEELAVQFGDKKFSAKSLQLNTLVTLVVLIISLAAAVGVWFVVKEISAHREDSNQMAINIVAVMKESIQASKELAQSQREGNCLLLFDQRLRQLHAEDCRRQAR